MVDMPTTPPSDPSSPHKAEKTEPKIQVPGRGFKAKPMTFLGMHFNAKEATQLWQVIIQTLNREIEKDKEKALKALRKLREDSENQ